MVRDAASNRSTGWIRLFQPQAEKMWISASVQSSHAGTSSAAIVTSPGRPPGSARGAPVGSTSAMPTPGLALENASAWITR